MKVLSIKQPWASLIARGIKTIENRTWKCPDKYIGQRILIHASSVPDKQPQELFSEKQSEIVDDYFLETLMSYDNTSAIVGSVIIEKCVQNHPSVWAEKGVWNWVLKDAEYFHHPIKDVKGKLGFWDY